MGTRSESGQEIDVRSCFAVPHSENEDQIAVDMPFQQGMQDLLSKNGTKEQIVGWLVCSLSVTRDEFGRPYTD